MFEKIILRRSINGPSLTTGELAEALLFYKNIHIVLDYGSVAGFVESIRMEGLLALLKRKGVSAVYCEETLGISTTSIGAMQYHSPVGFYLSGDSSDRIAKNREERLQFLLQRLGYEKKESRKLSEEFVRLVPNRKLSGDDFVKGGVIKAVKDDFLSPDFMKSAMRQIIENTPGAPQLGNDFTFDVFQSGEDFLTFSNLNIEGMNRSRQQNHVGLDPISHAHFLGEILHARADLHLAARYGGEFHTSASVSRVIQLRHAFLLERIGLDREELRVFQEVSLPNYPTVMEVINSKERSFDEFLVLLDKSQRFRDWIQAINPDEKLVSAYVNEVTSEGWISKLPAKALRYVIGSAIGAIADPVTGLISSAADAFLVEKLLGGWRPSHFVNKSLKPFSAVS